jgi:hypothetical protein
MDMERLFKIVITDLTSERLKLEEALESTINSKMEIETKVKTIKDILAKITINEASITKFSSMITNNNLQNNEENGTV